MKMPNKLTAWEFMPGEQNEWLRGGWDYSEERSCEMKYRNYVAADIAEEMARALEAVMVGEESADTMYAQMKAQDALTRFRAVMSST